MGADIGRQVSEAIDRLRQYFGDAATRQGVLARQALGYEVANDRTSREQIVADFRAELRSDGSVAGGAMPTIWRAHELMDMGQGGDQPGTVRVLRWILSLQGQPGGFGEGCSAERHQHRVCRHFVAGFFSPGPASERLAPVTMPNGKVFRAEPAARFTVSCLALRAALRALRSSERYPLVDEHIASLERLSQYWTAWNGYFAPDMIVAGLHALAAARLPDGGPVPKLVTLIAAHQDEGGGWPNTDLFHMLEALLSVNTPEARTLVQRALPALVRRQRQDGTFGATAQQERALIGLRALVWGR